MKIAVISDLHLAPSGAPDLFGHDDLEFSRFLRFLEQNFEQVVLLGDIWETLTGRFPGPSAELRRARDSHPDIARRLLGPRYTYVHGNHDFVAASAEGAPEEIAIVADGVRLLFTHGHQNDRLVQHARWVSEFGVWLGAWIRRFGLAAAYQALRRLDEKRHGATHDATSCAFQRWAVNVAELKSADVVITGHTHLATRAEHGSRLFLNSGSCSEGAITFLSIDTRRGEYAVHHSW
ncbi:MAG TPA: metallophosphoesterase family protein [Polyangiaceae bacterium]|nr:metallophosphoesterase family protein [Polyangiaceae bacterium]